MAASSTSFKPGKSGNPTGKKALPIDVVELCRSHTPAAIHALILALDSKNERVQAAKVLLDRGWGMPKQFMDTRVLVRPITPYGALQLTDEQRAVMEDVLLLGHQTIEGEFDEEGE